MNAAHAAQLDALGEPTRRAIVALLQSGALAVGDLAREFPVSRPAISQHLRVLKDARLVTDTAVGRQRLYQLDPAGFDSLRTYFDEFWTVALTAFQQRVEQKPAPKRRKP
jgi:DNA-binding transcriptional ArsR family regulator